MITLAMKHADFSYYYYYHRCDFVPHFLAIIIPIEFEEKRER